MVHNCLLIAFYRYDNSNVMLTNMFSKGLVVERRVNFPMPLVLKWSFIKLINKGFYDILGEFIKQYSI